MQTKCLPGCSMSQEYRKWVGLMEGSHRRACPSFPRLGQLFLYHFRQIWSPSFYKSILQWCFHCLPQCWCPTDTLGLSLHFLHLHSSLNSLITLPPPFWIPSSWIIFSFSHGVHNWMQCSVELEVQFMPPWGFLSLQEPFSSLSPSPIPGFQPRGKVFVQWTAGCKYAAKLYSGWREMCSLIF